MGFCVEMARGVGTIACSPKIFKDVTGSADVKQRITTYRLMMRDVETMRKHGDPSKAKEKEQEAAAQKRKLPGFCFQADTFDETEWLDAKGKNHGKARWRKQKNVRLNGLYMIDVDHVDDPKKMLGDVITKAKAEQLPLLLAFITPSGKGCKMIFKAQIEQGNLFQNQKAMATRLGIEFDEKCKDASRLSFTPMADDVLYIDEEIFGYYDKAYADKYDRMYNEGIQNPTFTDIADKEEQKTETTTEEQKTEATKEGDESPQLSDEEIKAWRYEGLSIDQIINLYMDGKEPEVHTRHDTLLKMVRDLRHVCNKNEQIIRYYVRPLTWVKNLAAEGDPVDQTISDAMNYRYYPKMPKKLEQILALHGKGEGCKENTDAEMRTQFAAWGEQIKALWGVYPCLKECCAELELPSYPAALFTGGCLFGTLGTRTYYHFYHNPKKKRRLNYGVFIISDPATGKSFAGDLFECIMEPVAVADKVGNDAINDYKKRKKMRQDSTKEQKKEALPPPEFPVRICGTRTANGVFIEHMINCKETIGGETMHLHLFTFDSELDSATAASKGGQWIDKSIFELKAFHNELDDQQYRNVDSVSGPFNVYWNYLYTGTPLSLSRKVTERNFGSGLYSRLACIPLCADEYKMMAWQESDKKTTEQWKMLHDWAYKMDKTEGLLPIEPIVKVAYDWCQEQMAVAQIENDKRIPMLCKRVPYYGINIAVPFILMRHWDEWEKQHTLDIDDTDKDFCRLIMDIQYYCQQNYFGKFAEMYLDNQKMEVNNRQNVNKNRKLDSMYDALPNMFIQQDLIDKGIEINNARMILSRWEKKEKVKKSGRGMNATYEKID